MRTFGSCLLSLLVFFCEPGDGCTQVLPDSAGWGYVLQADEYASSPEAAVARFSQCNRDILVMDFSYDGSRQSMWKKDHIHSIKSAGTKSPKHVIAYLSIGEAEEYRHYWQPGWDPEMDGTLAPNAPDFLVSENPEWEGNYKVRFWRKDWQNLILDYLSLIQSQGFDGVYLDIVDAFEFFEFDPESKKYVDGRVNAETGQTYRDDMVDWVVEIATKARLRNPDFFIIPQNGVQLLSQARYRKVISAVGVEDLWTDGQALQPEDHVAYQLQYIQSARTSRIPVVVIEYGKKQSHKSWCISQAQKLGLSLLLTNRGLTIPGAAYPSRSTHHP